LQRLQDEGNIDDRVIHLADEVGGRWHHAGCSNSWMERHAPAMMPRLASMQ
jgi:hypothetical protein